MNQVNKVSDVTYSDVASYLRLDEVTTDEVNTLNSLIEIAKALGKKCDLLILDDLGTEMPGQFVTAALYSLLNDRLLMAKPMVISTNLTVEETSRRYSPQIASRLQGGFLGLTFVGEDIRIMKNRGY